MVVIKRYLQPQQTNQLLTVIRLSSNLSWTNCNGPTGQVISVVSVIITYKISKYEYNVVGSIPTAYLSAFFIVAFGHLFTYWKNENP